MSQRIIPALPFAPGSDASHANSSIRMTKETRP